MKFNAIKRVALVCGITFGCALFGAADAGDVYVKNNTDIVGTWVSGSHSNLRVSWLDNGARKELIVAPGSTQNIGLKSRVTNLQYQNHGSLANAAKFAGLGTVYSVSDTELRKQPAQDVIVAVNDNSYLTGFDHLITHVTYDRARKALQAPSTFRDAGDLFPRIKAARDERSGLWSGYTLERFLEEKPHFFLNLPESSTRAQIQDQYKQLALKYHPDKNPSMRELASQAFNLLQTARDNMLRGR